LFIIPLRIPVLFPMSALQTGGQISCWIRP
jgi:hypothetical protein